MWIDTDHCTKPCSVVIPRISCKDIAFLPNFEALSLKARSVIPVLKAKKNQRTSFEQSLAKQCKKPERKSTRLNVPRGRLRSRQSFNFCSAMPASVSSSFPSEDHGRPRSTFNPSLLTKPGEWQRSASSNPFKLRLKYLKKEKPFALKRKWTLQHNRSEEPTKWIKEEPGVVPKVAPETEVEPKKSKNKSEVFKKSSSTTSSSVNSNAKAWGPKANISTAQSNAKAPLSKLVISCKKAYRYHQPVFSKNEVENSNEETGGEPLRTHRKMTAYTVYTKVKENSIESINCKRYKKRKEFPVKEEKSNRSRKSELKRSNFLSEMEKFCKEGSIEADVRATLESLLQEVVSAELDQLLNLETPSREIKTLLRSFCRQYGYNYSKDFNDLESSVLNFTVTDSINRTARKPVSRQDGRQHVPETSTSNVYSKHVPETSTSNVYSKHVHETSTSKLHPENLSETSTSNVYEEPEFKTSTNNVNAEPIADSILSNMYTKHAPEANSSNLNPKHESESSTGNLYPKLQTETSTSDLNPKNGSETNSSNIYPKHVSETSSSNVYPKPVAETSTVNTKQKHIPEPSNSYLFPKQPVIETSTRNAHLKHVPETSTRNAYPKHVPETSEVESNGTTYHKSIKRRRKRKWSSSDDSDEEESHEMMSAMMRSRSKERRNRLSRDFIFTRSTVRHSDLPKRNRPKSLRVEDFFPILTSDDSGSEACAKFKPVRNSNLVLDKPNKHNSDDDEETDCGDSKATASFFPSVSSDETSETEKKAAAKNTEAVLEKVVPVSIADNALSVVKKVENRDVPKKRPVKKFFSDYTPRECSSETAVKTLPVPESPANSLNKKEVSEALKDKSTTACAESMPNLSNFLLNLVSSKKDSSISSDVSSVHEFQPRNPNKESELKEVKAKLDTSEFSTKSTVKTTDFPDDVDSDSDNLVICLEAQPAADSAPEDPPVSSNSSIKTPDPPAREILYHTPKFHRLDNCPPALLENVTREFQMRAQETKEKRRVGRPSKLAADRPDKSKSMPVSVQNKPTPPTSMLCKEVCAGHLTEKHYRTPVQKVLPQIKPPVQKNVQLVHSHYKPIPALSRPSHLVNIKPKPPPNLSPVAAEPPIPVTLPGNAPNATEVRNQVPHITMAVNSSVKLEPGMTVTAPLEPRLLTAQEMVQKTRNEYIPPTTTDTSATKPTVDISSQATSVETPIFNYPEVPINEPPVTSAPFPLPQKMAPPVTVSFHSVPRIAGAVTPPGVPDPPLRIALDPSIPVSNLASSVMSQLLGPNVSIADVTQMNSQASALEISILRSLLLDPPPDGLPSPELHNLIIQKAKENEEMEENMEANFGLPIITNVVSLSEEAKKLNQDHKDHKMAFQIFDKKNNSTRNPSENDTPLTRTTDSPEIVAEKLKPATPPSKTIPPASPAKPNTISVGGISEVVRNLQIEISNLERFAEEKKKEYLLIMYLRNYKRDTLKRIQDGINAKEPVLPTPSKINPSAPSSAEAAQTHLKETCLVRPMVQTQPQPYPLQPIKIAQDAIPTKTPENKISVGSPAAIHRGMTLAKIIESQARSYGFPIDTRHSPGKNTPPEHLSQAALNKVDSEARKGFRPYLNPTSTPANIKEAPAPNPQERTFNKAPSQYVKYDPTANMQRFPSISKPSSVHCPAVKSTVTSSSTVQSHPTSVIQKPISTSCRKGTVNSYLQGDPAKNWQSKKIGALSSSTGPPPFASTVKNLMKHATDNTAVSSAGPIPSSVKDFPSETPAPSRVPLPLGATPMNAPSFLDFYPFPAVAAANSYLQSSFWPGSATSSKVSSIASAVQSGRDLYMNPWAMNDWRTLKPSHTEVESHGEKTSAEASRRAATISPSRPYHPEKHERNVANLAGHRPDRPLVYGTLRKCVVCKLADAQFICSGCGKDWYCSVTCQRQNWKIHSRSCNTSSN